MDAGMNEESYSVSQRSTEYPLNIPLIKNGMGRALSSPQIVNDQPVDQAWFGNNVINRNNADEYTKFEAQTTPSIYKKIQFNGTNTFWTFVLCAAPHVLFAFETFSVTMIIPFVLQQYNMSSSTVTWLLQAEYLLVTTLGTVCGKMCEKMGITNYFLIGSWIYTVFTFVTIFVAHDFSALLACRVLSSFGIAITLPASNPIILYMSSKVTLTKVVGWISSITSLMSILGTSITGVLSRYAHWSYMFGVLSGLSLVHSIIISVLLPRSNCIQVVRSNTYIKVDWIGLVLMTLSILTILTGFSCLHLYKVWVGVIVIIAGTLLLAGFGCYTKYCSRTPILYKGMTKNKQFYVGMTLNVFMNVAAYGEKFYQSYIFKNVYGQDVLYSSIFVSIPYVVLWIVGSFIPLMQFKITNRTLFLMWSGVYAGCLVIIASTLGRSMAVTIVFNCVTTVCYSGIITTVYTFALIASPHRYAAYVGSFNCVFVNLGRVLGVAMTVATQVISFSSFCPGTQCDAGAEDFNAEKLASSTRASYIAGLGLCVVFMTAGHICVYFMGVGKNERGRIGFREKLLAKRDTYDENRYNDATMVEVDALHESIEKQSASTEQELRDRMAVATLAF